MKTTAAALALLALAASAEAHFDRLLLSSRALSLGGAFVSIADDATAVVINPAGLVNAPRLSLLSTYLKPFALDDVDEGFVAASAVTRFGAIGASWYHRGMSGVLSENLLSLSFGRDLIRKVSNESLSIGANVDLAQVSASDRFDASSTVVTGGLSVLVRPFGGIGFGYALRNLREGTIHLVDGGSGTKLRRTHALGLSYRWRGHLVMTFEQRRDGEGEWRGAGGMEVYLGPQVTVRGGMQGRHATGGAGVQWRGVGVDVGVASHEHLGASYVITVGYGRPRPAEPYAQSP